MPLPTREEFTARVLGGPQELKDDGSEIGRNDDRQEMLQGDAAVQGLSETREKEGKGIAAVDGEKWPIFYLLPAPAISGQRGCTAKSPAVFAGVPA